MLTENEKKLLKNEDQRLRLEKIKARTEDLQKAVAADFKAFNDVTGVTICTIDEAIAELQDEGMKLRGWK